MTVLSLPVSFGEAADKIAILQIKRERIHVAEKLANIEAELRVISPLFFETVALAAGFRPLFEELKAVNARLWDIEEAVREHERREDFGAKFIELARAVYRTNDERVHIKRRIDLLLGSPLVEEKSYLDREPPPEPSAR